MLSSIMLVLKELWKRVTRCDDIYDVLFPLHLATKPFAISPHSMIMDHLKKRKYSVSILGSCYSLVSIMLFTAYYVFAVEERNRISYQETNKITNAIDAYQLYGAVIVMILAVVLNGLRQNTLIEAVSKIDDIDAEFAHNRISIEYKTSRNYIAVYVYCIQLLFIGLEYMNCSMFLRQIFTLSDMCLLMCYLPLLVNGFVECQFIIYLLLLRQRFSIINHELECLSNVVLIGGKGVNRLITLRRMHEDLCISSRMINETFALQILIIIGNTFVSFTTHAYYCFDGFVRISLEEPDKNVYNTATTAAWTLFKLLQLFAVTFVCTSLTNEANSAKNFIYKIDRSRNQNISAQITIFSKQIIHWDFKICAFGFFNLDLTLFYSAVASATAYLFILLQLDIANRQPENTIIQ
ncbi:PREDICTED: putative gustatory receptor 28b [Nicrophorus vespilloides]|uniref:Gustatory receptor n=1 Tax=Nicrophorus vespilloides TaxID=110193 RepID=A0ABM1NEU6_NICVS|nr:PREDICTED: putative gustatory receptor 28b [Nicrophorus vespilloides]